MVLGQMEDSRGGNGTGYRGPVEVVLVEAGRSIAAVLELIKRVMSLTITQGPALVEALPLTLYRSLPRAEAERIRQAFRAVGAEVEFRVPRARTPGLSAIRKSSELAA